MVTTLIHVGSLETSRKFYNDILYFFLRKMEILYVFRGQEHAGHKYDMMKIIIRVARICGY